MSVAVAVTAFCLAAAGLVYGFVHEGKSFAIEAAVPQLELQEKNNYIPLDQVMQNLRERDMIDSSRADSPLKQAEDAFIIDTSELSIEEQVRKVLDLTKVVAAEKE